jgi:hypothetical protein
MALNVTPISLIDYARVTSEAGGVFCSAQWLGSYGEKLRTAGIHNEDAKLIGGFYYYEERRLGVKFIKLPPYSPYCGLHFQNPASNTSSRSGFSKEVMEAVCGYLLGLGGKLMILAFPPEVIDMQPFIWQKFKVVPNYTYRIDLSKTIEEINGAFDPKHRNMISKAVKAGNEIKYNALDAAACTDYFSSSLETAGANVYPEELAGIFGNFAGGKNGFSLSAYHNGKMTGCVFCVHDQRICYYLLGGASREHQGVNNLLVARCIEKARELGCAIFDFEGSMLKGVEKFFRGFGPELVPYYTVNRASLPIEILLKFKKRELF